MNKEQAKFMLYGQVFGLAKASSIAKKRMQQAEKFRVKTNFAYSKGYAETQCNWLMIRFQTRHHQLAYGLIRGVPYRKIEKKTSPTNKPHALEILRILKHTFYDSDLYFLKIDDASIKEWLNVA